MKRTTRDIISGFINGPKGFYSQHTWIRMKEAAKQSVMSIQSASDSMHVYPPGTKLLEN